MAEYIDREALMKFPIRRDHYDRKNGNEHFINGIESVLDYAENLPSVDVATVRHGRWEFRRSEKHKFNTDAVCTACNTAVDSHPENNLEHRQTSIKKKLRYCPNCGAKMDLEVMDSGQK